MKSRLFSFLLLWFIVIVNSPCFSGANNNTPQDAFSSYQIALKNEDVNLLLEVYHMPKAANMSQSQLLSELRYLKKYDGYKNYSIYLVLEEEGRTLLKVKGTLGGRENVKRTFQLKHFNTGWKITQVWNN